MKTRAIRLLMVGGVLAAIAILTILVQNRAMRGAFRRSSTPTPTMDLSAGIQPQPTARVTEQTQPQVMIPRAQPVEVLPPPLPNATMPVASVPSTPTPQAGREPAPSATVQPSATFELPSTVEPTSTVEPASPEPPPPEPTDPKPDKKQKADGSCSETIGAVTIDKKLEVPSNATCTLNGTRVMGAIFVHENATLIATGIYVDGNIQAKNASRVEILSDSLVDGNVQVSSSGAVQINSVRVNGNLQLNDNSQSLNVFGNIIAGNFSKSQIREIE